MVQGEVAAAAVAAARARVLVLEGALDGWMMFEGRSVGAVNKQADMLLEDIS